MRHLVTQMVQAVVLAPESVHVEESVEEDATHFVVTVAPSDIDYAIGNDGQVASAMRTILKEAAKRSGCKVYMDVRGRVDDDPA